MRLFIAVNIPDEIKEKFALAVRRLRYKITDVKWIKEENFHITLKFLGEIKEEKVPQISGRVSEITKVMKPFAVSFEGFGFFPDEKHPRIIWSGVKEGFSQLERLAETIEEAMSLIGVEKEKRKFSAHLTLGRIKSFRSPEASFENIESQFGSFTLEKIDLMQSFLDRSGPEYKCLESFKFGAK